MTIPAITAAVQAAQDFADSLEALQDALAAPASTAIVVGQVISPDDARGLPLGSSFRDREGDVWYVTEHGFSWVGANYGTTMDPEDYTPLILEALPEPADLAAPTLEPLTEGDEVRITGLTVYARDRIGQTGRVTRVDSDDYIVVEIGTGWDVETRVYERSSLEKVTPEPAPAPKVGDRVRVTQSILGKTEGQLIGHEGTLTKIETGVRHAESATGTRYSVNPYWYAGGVEVVEAAPEPEPEPAPTTLDIESQYADRRISIERIYNGSAQVTLVNTNRDKAVFAYFTRDQARQIAATLLAIADA